MSTDTSLKHPSSDLCTLEDDPITFKRLSKRPFLAVPTAVLWIISTTIWVSSIALGVAGELPYAITFLSTAWSAFLLFTVMHDASHRAISTKNWVNSTLGQFSILSLTPAPIFPMFRFIHMQHHRFTNEMDGSDPDHWVSTGSTWLIPIKCAFIDAHYYFWYLKRMNKRPRQERITVIVSLLIVAILFSAFAYMSWLDEFFLYYYLPSRLTAFALAFSFDYLPHAPYLSTGKKNKYRATNLRLGWSWVLTPILVYQNYHLMHHLYPLIPFYRYAKVYRAKKRSLIENDALVVKPLGLSEIPTENAIKQH